MAPESIFVPLKSESGVFVWCWVGPCVWTRSVLTLLLFPRVRVLGLAAGRGGWQAVAKTPRACADPGRGGKKRDGEREMDINREKVE